MLTSPDFLLNTLAAIVWTAWLFICIGTLLNMRRRENRRLARITRNYTPILTRSRTK